MPHLGIVGLLFILFLARSFLLTSWKNEKKQIKPYIILRILFI